MVARRVLRLAPQPRVPRAHDHPGGALRDVRVRVARVAGLRFLITALALVLGWAALLMPGWSGSRASTTPSRPRSSSRSRSCRGAPRRRRRPGPRSDSRVDPRRVSSGAERTGGHVCGSRSRYARGVGSRRAMRDERRREAEEAADGAVAPGALTALLNEVARAPSAEHGSRWDDALRPGTVVGRFELLREIGRGGFGVVYEARDRQLGRSSRSRRSAPAPARSAPRGAARSARRRRPRGSRIRTSSRSTTPAGRARTVPRLRAAARRDARAAARARSAPACARPSGSRSRWRGASPTRTRRASCTAISSRRTSS